LPEKGIYNIEKLKYQLNTKLTSRVQNSRQSIPNKLFLSA